MAQEKANEESAPSQRSVEDGQGAPRPSAAPEAFPELAQAAAEAAADVAQLPSPAVPQSAKVEVYADEHRLNQAANRKLRNVAFYAVGALTALYVLVLLCVLWRFFDGRLLSSIIGASSGSLDWHVLVLIGIALVIFAAVPLSFTMALVKMISDRSDCSDEVALKTPSTELGKVLLDLFRSIAQAARSP